MRRLASKCASTCGASRLSSYLSPRQLGVGVPGACEAAIHSARRYLETIPFDHVFVKLDFSNAFNSLNRSDMLCSVADRIPDLYAFCYSAYYHSSILFHGPYLVFSQEGPQQGDPLGPLLFCNTIHPLLQSLEANLSLGFLDDLSLGAADDVSNIINEGEHLGLTMNMSKCELITHLSFNVQVVLLCSFQHVEMEETILLAVPLFVRPALNSMCTVMI